MQVEPPELVVLAVAVQAQGLTLGLVQRVELMVLAAVAVAFAPLTTLLLAEKVATELQSWLYQHQNTQASTQVAQQ
jgi:hypothetical protein